ncbi:MAG: RNA methyltransferase [Proteobacteria bacterium]|nr:RNA methyltransferase [Pseudomonadota bacterium]
MSPVLIPIEDPADPRVAAYRDVRERDLVGREGRFIAEGEVVLRVLLRQGRHRPLSLLIDAKRVGALQLLLDQVPEGVPIYAAGQAVMDAIVGFHIHRGILALGERADALDAEALLAGLPERATVAVLIGAANHDNVGGVFRNAAAFGAAAVLLDATCCDPLYRKAIRVSVGAALEVPYARVMDGAAAISLLRHHGFEVIALSPSGRTTLAEFRPGLRTAAMFGTEGEGLPQAVMDLATTVSIPMAGAFDSLNLATTSGIVLHHLAFSARP